MTVEQSAELMPFADDDARWAAVLGRERSADGHFLLGVMTTGVYCRPFCPSRTALRKNVNFYLSPEAAEAVGLRPYKRCRPALARFYISAGRSAGRCQRQGECSPRALWLAESGHSRVNRPASLRLLTRAVKLRLHTFARHACIAGQRLENKHITTGLLNLKGDG